jgi:DNA-binding winged helix-turn-helix (wHTH) protein
MQYRKPVPLTAKWFKNGLPLPCIRRLLDSSNRILREGNIMKPPLAMAKPWREPMDHDGSPIVARRASPAATDVPLEFGRFRVLLRQRRLLVGGEPVELGARAFDVLMALIEADGALVTKDELQSRVWPDVVVAPDNLKVQIAALRKALGEDRELVRTDHGRGYRFTATVRATATAAEPLLTSGASTPQSEWKPVSHTDLSVIASRLMRLEVGLADALSLLGTHRTSSRLRRRRYYAGSSCRKARRPRPVGSVSRSMNSHEKATALPVESARREA